MNQIASASALLVAAILGWAWIAKLRDRAATAKSFAGLGVRLPVGAVVVAELATAVALIVRPRSGAIASVVLLGAFTAVLVQAMARPGAVTCGCKVALRTLATVPIVRAVP